MQAVDKGRETPMERLKRLRAAQINKAFQKDALTVAQRRLQDERDRRARETIERAAAATRRRSPSPPSPRWHATPPSQATPQQPQASRPWGSSPTRHPRRASSSRLHHYVQTFLKYYYVLFLPRGKGVCRRAACKGCQEGPAIWGFF